MWAYGELAMLLGRWLCPTVECCRLLRSCWSRDFCVEAFEVRSVALRRCREE